MGLNAPSGSELAATALTGAFNTASHTTSAIVMLEGLFNISFWGTFTATAQLERSFDGGTTFLPATTDATGTVAAWTAATSVVAVEPEPGVYYRLNCTSYTSGTLNYRLSAGPRLT